VGRGGRNREPARASASGLGVRLIVTLTVMVSVGFLLPAAAPAINYQPADQILVNHFVTLESGLLKITPVAPVSVVESPGRVYGQVNGKTVPAYVVTTPNGPPGDPGGPVRSCTITVGIDAHQISIDPTKPPGPHNPPSKNLGYINEELKTFFAHEVFHCLSAKLAGTIVNFDKHRAWLIEGGATWVSSDLVDHSLVPHERWLTYLESPLKPLFNRDEDAIGFFGHLAHSGISPWHVFPAMFAAAADVAAYEAAVNGDMTFLDSEASAFYDAGGFGAAWVPKGQGSATADSNVPQHSTSLPKKGPAPRRTETLSAPAYADNPVALTLAAPKTELAVKGGEVRLHATGGGGSDVVNPGAIMLCEHGGKGCDCPGRHITFPKGDLAITGGTEGGQVELIGMADCPALPPRACSGLLPLSEFPGATSERVLNIAPLSACTFSTAEPEEGFAGMQPPDLVGGVDLVTLGNATMAHEYFVKQFEHCHRCSPLQGIGDEAYLSEFTEEEDIGTVYTGYIGFARIDNDIVTIQIVTRRGTAIPELLRLVIAELLAEVK
jgi:hypothetical protein